MTYTKNNPSENIIKLRELINSLDSLNESTSEQFDLNQDLFKDNDCIYMIQKTIDSELEHVNDSPSLRHKIKCYESTINKIKTLVNTH